MDHGPGFEFEGEHRLFAQKYRPVRVLGRGGMGLVFEAKHTHLEVPVAIKLLNEDLRGHAELVARFEREAAVASSLTSAHAVKVFDYDMTSDGRPFIVMERLKGEDLAHLLERSGPQPPARVAGWILQACDAIAEAHERGIIHRDIKPSNLFLADVGGQNVVKVVDFGIAKREGAGPAITQQVAPLGTPQYMAPEQIRHAATADQRADIWSLGITLYELVTGRTPFADHESPVAIIAAIVADPVPDPRTFAPDLPDAFRAVLSKALAKDPSARYATVRELMRALQSFTPERPGDAAPRAIVVPALPIRQPASSCEAVVVSPAAAVPALSVRKGWAPRAAPRRWTYAAVAMTLVAGLAHATFSVDGAPRPPTSASSFDPRPDVPVLALPPPAVVIPPAAVVASVSLSAPTVKPATAESPSPRRARNEGGAAPPPKASAGREAGAASASRYAVVHGGLSGPGF